MNGLLQHLALTLKLNFRSKQAVVYGYLVPLFFLLAFGSVFRSGKPPLVREMGQLLTITVLGGACFGMPTAMVAERERGVWRRYRLLPSAIGGILLSSMVARFVIVLSAAVLQVFLARLIYGTPLPNHPWGLAATFPFVAVAFLGIGLVIAMLADSVPAVQALGQAVFLPMIMIGGVGISLRLLPPWAQRVAGYLPGRYAVEAMQACVNGPGLAAVRFDLLALTFIAAAACLAGAKLFRWDVGQRLAPPARAWVVAAVAAWVSVGVVAQRSGRLSLLADDNPNAGGTLAALVPNRGMPALATQPAGGTPATTRPVISFEEIAAEFIRRVFGPPPAASQPVTPWKEYDDAAVAKITFDDLPPDRSTVTPVAESLEDLDDDRRQQLEKFAIALESWDPGKTKDVGQRVRYLLSVCGVADHVQDPLESYIPYVVFQQLRDSVPKDQLIKALAWIIYKPGEGAVVEEAKDLGIEIQSYQEAVRERSAWYAKKLLWRVLEKGKPDEYK